MGARILAVVAALGAACAGPAASPSSVPAPSSSAVPAPPPAATLEQAESALASGEAARAVALFSRVVATGGSPDESRQAQLGLARAHELLHDYAAAIRAYDAYVEHFSDAPDLAAVYARRGAGQAQLERWEESAASYARALELAETSPPSFRVEALARRGYALFQLDRLDEADADLARADAIHDDAAAHGTERFANFYFVGMARFYRAAVLHRRFRELPIRLPEARMATDFAAKLDLLVRAQDAYNHTIRAKHVFWVSAAGWQLGSLFEEFYDALMYAPVPEWLDDRQRRVYYEELKKQLRPVVNKAIWVFEKNLETARALGYENPFIDRTEESLAHLQAVLLAGDTNLGKPHPRLATEVAPDDPAPPDHARHEDLSPADRKLFVPLPTPL
jgi:tetratricopeptide (TPR) repeat protein